MKHSFIFPPEILIMALVIGLAAGSGTAASNTDSAAQFRNRRAQIEERIRQAEGRVFSSESESAYDAERTKFGMNSLMRQDS